MGDAAKEASEKFAGAVGVQFAGSVRANGKEIMDLARRLTELMPPGSSAMFTIPQDGPKLVQPNGMPVNARYEIVHVHRPIVYGQIGTEPPK